MPIPLQNLNDYAFPGETGIAERYAAPLDAAAKAVAAEVKEGKRPFWVLPRETRDLAEIREVADGLRADFDHVVVIGTGGSSLGARCVTALAPADTKPKLHFLENADPHTLHAFLTQLPLEKTAFVFISKSGNTLETLSQALVITKTLESKFDAKTAAKACVVITEPKDSALTKLAVHYGIRTLEHDPNLGGRFSVMGNVGLLPVAVAGLDIAKVRAGAASQTDTLVASPNLGHPAVAGALFQHHHLSAGKNVHVIMPYADRLKLLGDWFRQLTAESLGKDGHGFTPLSALGTVDHHSMLQLFLDGPGDKFFTFLTLGSHDEKEAIDSGLSDAVGLPHLKGKTLGNVIDAAAKGTIETVQARGLPLREIMLPKLDEESLGALLMQFELETAITAELIGVNAYDQPAVEESKQRTMKYLTR